MEMPLHDIRRISYFDIPHHLIDRKKYENLITFYLLQSLLWGLPMSYCCCFVSIRWGPRMTQAIVLCKNPSHQREREMMMVCYFSMSSTMTGPFFSCGETIRHCHVTIYISCLSLAVRKLFLPISIERIHFKKKEKKTYSIFYLNIYSCINTDL